MPDRSWALQRKLMRAPNIGFNAEVRRWFADIDDVPNANRTALRDSLLIQATESRSSALFKVQYFREFVQKVHSKPSIIGIPKEQFDIGLGFEYKPVVNLYFQQDKASITVGYAPVTAEISFRLMNESNESLTKANVETLAKKIKTDLAAGQGYTFNKGKNIVNYIDKKLGYYLQVYVINEAEGVEVVRKILSIQGHTYDEDKLRISQPKKNSVNTSTAQITLGGTYKKPRWRPTATVRFQWASLSLYGVPEPIYLVDRTLSRFKPIEVIY